VGLNKRPAKILTPKACSQVIFGKLKMIGINQFHKRNTGNDHNSAAPIIMANAVANVTKYFIRFLFILVVRTGFEPALGLTTYDILFITTPSDHLTNLVKAYASTGAVYFTTP
jgi:hypothetical protein